MSLKGIFFSIDKGVNRFNRFLLSYAILINNEIRHNKRHNLFVRIKAFINGTASTPYLIYKGKKGQYYKYCLSDFDFINRLTYINDKYGILLADKLLAYKYFHLWPELFPKLYFVLRDGRLFIAYNGVPEKIIDWDHFFSVLTEKQSLIIKSTLSYGGLGVNKLDLKGEGAYTLNKNTFSREELVKALEGFKGEFIITEYFNQTGYAHNIFPDSVNTIRILTINDSDQEDVWIGAAVHRFGCKASGFLDNWTSGGVSTLVDLESGILGKCAVLSENKTGINYVESHPETKVNISGQQISHWEDIKTLVLTLARFAHKCPIIGWDVAVSDERIVVLEANNSPNVHIIQYHIPLLQNEKNRRFFGKYGINPK